MFTTFIMACSMMTGQCVIFEDSRGPYQNRVQCQARAEEMVIDMSPILVGAHTYSFKCEEEKGV